MYRIQTRTAIISFVSQAALIEILAFSLQVWICLEYFKNGDANLKVSALSAFRDLERHV